MSDNKQKLTFSQKISGLKAEFAKIFWPDRFRTTKQSTAVIIITAIMGLIIVFFDMIIQYGVDFLVQL